MKTPLIIFQVLIIAAIISFSSCNEENLISSNDISIRFLSFQSNGCGSANSMLKVNDEPILNWEYLNGNLTIDLLFRTLCSARIKDSTLIANDEIIIYISDTNPVSERCTCPHNEQFRFRVHDIQDLKIIFYFKQYFQPDYHLLIECIINLEWFF